MKIACQILFMAVFAQAAVAQSGNFKNITSFQKWSAFIDRNGTPFCWAATIPTKAPGFILKKLLVYVTHEGVFSIQDSGQEIAKRSTAVLNVSGVQYPMLISENAVFLEDPGQDSAVIQALATARSAQVVFDKGRQVSFSTRGFAEVFPRAVKACED